MPWRLRKRDNEEIATVHLPYLRPLVICACLLISHPTWADAPRAQKDVGEAASLSPTEGMGPLLAQGMMGPGMMGPGRMMGPGMMGQGPWTNAPPASGTTAPPSSDDLTSFVSANGLACFGCHAATGRGVGPSFDAIAHRYAGQPHARSQLARSIAHGVSGRWAGYPPMPPAQATPAQANRLARLILARTR